MFKKIFPAIAVSLLFVGAGCVASSSVQKNTTPANQPVIENGKPVSTDNVSQGLAVTWQKPVEIASLHLFTEKVPTDNGQKGNYIEHSEGTSLIYYNVGQTMYGNSMPASVVVAKALPVEMGDTDYIFFIVTKGANILLSQHVYSSFGTELNRVTNINQTALGLNPEKFVLDTGTYLQGLDFPKTVETGSPRQVLMYKSAIWFDQSIDLKKVFESKSGGVFANSVIPSQNAFFLDSASPLRPMYISVPDFFDKDLLVPQITWNNGEKNTAEYSYVSMGGCGSTNYAHVVDPKDINVATDLVIAGKNNQHDPIYELKDKNHSKLKDLYSDAPLLPKLSYEKSLELRPLIYWVDPFGRLIELRNKKFQFQAECGKPVIYLYPEQTTDVSVHVAPVGGLTKTEPNYGSGWNVRASHEGKLTDLKTGDIYPYLFWEGRGGIYETPKKGWTVKQGDLSTFLPQKLAELGLNKTESADFMEFWLPLMQDKPYYFVTFMGNAMMDNLAPLTIDPKPDTVIRILMDFTPLDKSVDVQGFDIRTPKRSGFTVVEWGGVLR